MKIIFGTFYKFINNKPIKRTLAFNEIVNELGEPEVGEVYIDNQTIISSIKLKFQGRYLIKFKTFNDKTLQGVIEVKNVSKSLKCKTFRFFKDEIHIISGKYKGKKNVDLSKNELSKYCIWLARNTYNELTLKNCLKILKLLNDEK